MIDILKPIFIEPLYARISISDWNFDKEDGDQVEVRVFDGLDDKGNPKFIGEGIISRKHWVETCKFKESKIIKKPEPITFYHNDLIFLTEQELAKREYDKYLN